MDEVRAELRASAFADLERRFAFPAMVVVGPAEDWGPSAWTRPAEPGREPPLMMLPPLLVTLAPRGLTGTRVTFGRMPPCDVVLPFRQLSREHAHFIRVADGWEVEDAGSRNGTVLDGKPLSPGTPVPLRDGAKLRFGDVIAHFMLSGALHEYLRREPRMETPRFR
ncbi:MAG TPA: FHA domain-containing protein [Myxococcales bacterium]|nr:FHA domain-containing protein [Myxococcales bacterium]